MNIIISNRLEVLSRALAEVVRTPRSSPLDPEIIVVQSRGMERWISLELAEHNGIFANGSFPFPNTFLQDIFRILIPDLPDASPFDPGVMTFRIMGLLPSFLNRPGFESLKAYLDDGREGLKSYQLSEKIADVFDQYLVFRPEMIFQWEAGKAEHWQAQLWRALTEGNDSQHRAQLRRIVFERLRGPLNSDQRLPQRVSIFGISYLPPFHIETFAELSRYMTVNVFLLNPCREYWADIVTDREQSRIREKYSTPWGEHQPLHLERGNRLIASMGILGRDFFHLIHEFDSYLDERFEDGGVDTLLSCIQTDILNLEDRPSPSEPYPLKVDDTSIRIHACHSPMREIEVLHDHLLAMFEEDPALMPKDVFVMTPDIETYAPYIHAVFDAQTDEDLHIPYRVADRSVRSESRVIEGFMSLLDLKDSRMSAVQVMARLEIAPIREAYDLSESDLDMIRRWIKDTNIRWGIDGASRRKIGLPDLPDNTWRSGIDRLLLGYAMPGGDRRLYEGILPYDHIEGNDALVLGKFLEFIQQLFEMSDDLKHDRNIGGWSSFLNGILESFITGGGAFERDTQVVRQAIEALTQQAALAEWNETVDLNVICSYLDQRFSREDMGFGFISGGVTFCAMLPMRSIPAKVICLIGMGTEAFPRKSTSLGFDYLARYPKRGDRSRRNDDKYLFLEALISARERLYISYVGRSIRDNSRIPPSSLVSELLDYIADGFGLSESRLVTLHRLQAFSPRYFKEENGELFSYSKENLLAAVSYDDEKGPSPFLSGPLAPPPEAWRHLTIEQWAAFYNHPTRYFLDMRLGMKIREQQTLIDETENFNLDGLEKYSIGQDLVRTIQPGDSLKGHMQLQRAKGTLPHGKVGEVLYGEMSADAEDFINRISGPTAGDRFEARDVRFHGGDFQVAGTLSDLFEIGQVRVRYGNKRAKDLLNAWLYHLMLHEVPDTDIPRQTLLICKDSAWQFDRLDNSREILASLLESYWRGLSEPIHFFPESSFIYGRSVLVRHKEPDDAVETARKKWEGNEFSRGESDDPHYQLCFSRTDPIDDAFEKIALEIFGPLLENVTEYVL